MTLQSNLSSWKLKKAEAERMLKEKLDDYPYQNKWGEASRIAGENINRIENVLKHEPWTDDLTAEEFRHSKAKEDIMKRWENRTHPAVA